MVSAGSNTDPSFKQITAALSMQSLIYTLFAQYYVGNHRLAYASEKFRNAFGRLFAAFADNQCSRVVDILADRLNITGFQCCDDPLDPLAEPDDALAAWAWTNLWEQNRMTRKAGEVHQEALRCGDAYVIVWPNSAGRPIIHPQPASLCTLHVDQEDPSVKLWGAKGWIEPETRLGRLNVYYPDKIEKFVTINRVQGALPARDAAWAEFDAPGEPWPLPNEWGEVPLFHFANNAMVGETGKSELKDILPLQDALNKAVLDMMVAMEFVSLPQRWIAGIEYEIDPQTGLAKLPFQASADRIWAINDKDTKFGEFAAADLTQFIEIANGYRMEIARIASIPLHFMNMQGGNPPSGEALRALEAGLIKKVKDRQNTFGDVWEDVFNLALRMSRKEGHVSVTWEDPAPIGELEHAQALTLKKALGVSEKQILTEMGYSEQKIEEMRADRLTEAQTGAAEFAAGQPEPVAGVQAGGEGAYQAGGSRNAETAPVAR
jgi:hypothetical protein